MFFFISDPRDVFLNATSLYYSAFNILNPQLLAVKAYSFEVGESSSESEGGGMKTMRQAPIPSPATTGPYYPPRPVHDLISLVEKGKVGISSNSSCCSSTTSSVGDRHGIPAAKIVSQGGSAANQTRYGWSASPSVCKSAFCRTSNDIRETKIDNHHSVECHAIETSAIVERNDISSNNNDVSVLFFDSCRCLRMIGLILVHSRDEHGKRSERRFVVRGIGTRSAIS